MSKKYYAVREGHKPGIYHSWPEAQKQILRYSGATYKSFKTLAEAEGFMANKSMVTFDANHETDDETVIAAVTETAAEAIESFAATKARG